MKQKGAQAYFFSVVGVLVMFIILVAINWIAARGKVRIDLTEERAYTLSDGTRKILAKVNKPMTIRFYFSRSDSNMPEPLKVYAQRVSDLLDEYRQYSNGKIEIQRLDPVPDTDAEESARTDNLESFPSLDGENLYLGVSITMLTRKETLSLLEPTLDRLNKRERLLEYQISRAIARVINPEKPTIGLMSTLPVAGQSPMMRRPGQRGGEEWALLKELKNSFNVQQLESTAETIPDNIKVLVVIHPKGITDVSQYALDQFVMRGGKLVAFLDPSAALDQQAGGPMGGGVSTSSLDKLLKAWGLTFDSTKVLADMNYVAPSRQGRTPGVLTLTDQAMNSDDVITAGMDNLVLAFGGVFGGAPVEGLKQTILFKSSTNSQLVDPTEALMGSPKLIQNFVPSGIEYPLAVRLTGKFKTAFPDGKPKAPEPKPEDAKPGEPKPEKPPEAPAPPGLKETAAENEVILVGDTDFLQDRMALAMDPMTMQPIPIPANANIPFAQAAIEQLGGDTDLIKVRSRASRARPFTVVKKLEAEAEARSQSKIKDFETKAAELDRKLMELVQSKAGSQSQMIILPPEQVAERNALKAQQIETRKDLRAEKKTLRRDVDSLKTKVKWVNLLVMPFLVVVLGLLLAVVRRHKQAAA